MTPYHTNSPLLDQQDSFTEHCKLLYLTEMKINGGGQPNHLMANCAPFG